QILARVRNSLQWADRMPGPDRLVARLGGEPRLFAINFDKGVQLLVMRPDSIEQRVNQLNGGEPACGDLGRQNVGRQQGRVGIGRRHLYSAMSDGGPSA